MTKAQELRAQLDARKEAEREEAQQRAKERRQAAEAEASRLVPIMFKRCVEACQQATEAGDSAVHLTFDGNAAQHAARGVVGRLRKQNFKVSYRFDSYGFRMDSEGYTLSEGTPYVAIDISW